MADIGIIGSEGRMGQAIASLLADGSIASLLDGEPHAFAGGVDHDGDVAALAKAADTLVDFSSPDALLANLTAATAEATPTLIGTTGLTEAHHHAIDAAAEKIPLLQTGNTSLGVQLLAHLVHRAAEKLGPEWDIEIVEMHHRHKVDAPSGTAKILGIAAAEGRGISLEENTESGRDGMTGVRKEGAIGFAALRGGSVAGDHSVILAGEQERITLSHNAENRLIFARGAIKAAAWLIGKPPDRYTMNDVLDL